MGFEGWNFVDMAVSSTGDMLISGESDAPLDYGAGVMQPVAPHNGFFARYDPAGNVLHGALLPSETISPIGVAVDAADNTVVAAWTNGTFDLGGGAMGTPGEDELYLIRLDPSGHFISGKSIAEGSGASDGFGAAVDGAGNAWLCGAVVGPITVGGAPVEPVSQSDVLLLKLDPAGDVASQRQFGTSGSSHCGSIRLGPTGVPVISGGMTGSIDFGQGLLHTIGSGDVFIATLGPGGG
jgi:hypothetical protein